jgi:uncharacterized spore protein YtfJ
VENVERFFKTAMEEMVRLLNTRSVVGEPIAVEGNTLIPLVSLGFGFGAAGGTGQTPGKEKGEGTGGGGGGGGGIKPVAVIVVGREGVRLEPVKAGTASLLGKVVETIGRTRRKDGGGSAESQG